MLDHPGFPDGKSPLGGINTPNKAISERIRYRLFLTVTPIPTGANVIIHKITVSQRTRTEKGAGGNSVARRSRKRHFGERQLNA